MRTLNTLLIVALLFAACGSPNVYKKYSNFAFLFKGRPAMVVSCIKCDCIINEMNRIKQQTKLMDEVDVYMDTSCQSFLNPGIRVIHLAQTKIDSLSVDFYNALLIKNESVIYEVPTEKANKLELMLK